jgi:hypothetical protein
MRGWRQPETNDRTRRKIFLRGMHVNKKKDYEYLIESSKAIIHMAMTRLMLGWLAHDAPYGVPSRQRLGLKH